MNEEDIKNEVTIGTNRLRTSPTDNLMRAALGTVGVIR